MFNQTVWLSGKEHNDTRISKRVFTLQKVCPCFNFSYNLLVQRAEVQYVVDDGGGGGVCLGSQTIKLFPGFSTEIQFSSSFCRHLALQTKQLQPGGKMIE